MNVDAKLLLRLLFFIIPVPFASYLFYELGHWIVGEALVNNMSYI